MKKFFLNLWRNTKGINVSKSGLTENKQRKFGQVWL